jgi:hypothetical protein
MQLQPRQKTKGASGKVVAVIGAVVDCTAQKDSPNMRPFQGIHRETGLKSDKGQTSKTMLSE